MKQIRKRLTYANVMSSIAVFLVLGGATAFAASKITAKQLQSNSVTTAKIKKNAVTASKIKNNSITTSKIADKAVTGAKIDVSTLGTVANANNAATANFATKAGTSAKTEQIANIFFASNEGSPQQTILNLGGLSIQSVCPAGGESNEITATTAESHSVIDVVTAQDNDYDDNIDFNVGETFDVDEGHSEGDTEMYTLQYTRPNGINVVVTLHDIDSEDGPAFPTTSQQRDCLVSGIATVANN